MARTRIGIGGVGRTYKLIKAVILGGKRSVSFADNALTATAANNHLSVTYADNNLTVKA